MKLLFGSVITEGLRYRRPLSFGYYLSVPKGFVLWLLPIGTEGLCPLVITYRYRRPLSFGYYLSVPKGKGHRCCPEQLGFCLTDVKLQELEDPKETLEDITSNFTCVMYDTPEEVLICAKNMVACRFGCRPEQLEFCLTDVKPQDLEDPKETLEEMASNFTCVMYDAPEEVLKCAKHVQELEVPKETPEEMASNVTGLLFEIFGMDWCSLSRSEMEESMEKKITLTFVFKVNHSTFSKASLWEVASRFRCSAEQLGFCLTDVKPQDLENPKETPEEMASNFTCAMYDSPKKVVKCFRCMVCIGNFVLKDYKGALV
ncbi:hypothetical protein LR48_Vigan01g042100 [Vigna angularis]|uniref:Uncharacterized protein n=1 Tax=Phaseolus angularis TaxID=3914 RepID=A0A0L9TK52_PHAAN|nr:hypothetical protein LR48_Vigan01g042100 [Vigna angularis]